MAEKVNKAAALLKDTKVKAKASGAKLYSLAKDPDTQAKAKKLLEDGKKCIEQPQAPRPKRPTVKQRKSLRRHERNSSRLRQAGWR